MGHQENEGTGGQRDLTSLVLEYAGPVWHSSLTAVQSRSLDRAQRVAMAAIIGRWESMRGLGKNCIGRGKINTLTDRLCIY